ncbi:hypothetical protein BDR05DRAFT_1004995 [Suillus weaverae]|nr:hypothetical protein BDR05DRAFT_1004995 [Suillus weaverae]
MLKLNGKHSRIDPYFMLPTLRQPEIKDICTVKAQFELRTLNDSYPAEAVMCSKKAANTLMYVVSACEKIRKSDKHEPLFPEASEPKREIVLEFSLEDFENTDVTFTRDVLKQHYSGKNKATVVRASLDGKDIDNWSVKDMPDPHGHFQTVKDLYGLDDVPVIVLNVRDTDGSLIHPSEYSKCLDNTTPVAMEVLLQLWTFGPENKHATGSRIYQTTLKSLHVLPLTERKAGLPKSIDAPADPKGKCKADGPAPQGGPTKKAAQTGGSST